MKVVIIDNYDSFTFNLYQYCGEILNKRTLSGQNEIIVKRNDEITVKNLENFNPDKIIISPGPGSPDKKEYFGNCQDIILKLGKSIPILGICLGMQGIVHSFGGKIIHSKISGHRKKQNMSRKIAKNESVVSKQTYTHQNMQKWGIGPKKSGKQCSKAMQKIRQQCNHTYSTKNEKRKQMYEQ